jgi:hypothetical protein
VIFAGIGEGKPHIFVGTNEITLAGMKAYSIWKKNNNVVKSMYFLMECTILGIICYRPRKNGPYKIFRPVYLDKLLHPYNKNQQDALFTFGLFQ